MTCYSTYLLDKHEAEVDASYALETESHKAWHVTTTAWDDYANTVDELAEMLADAVKSGLQAEITEVPF